MNLLEDYDNAIPMDSFAHEFGVRQVSLEQSIQKQLKATTSPRSGRAGRIARAEPLRRRSRR